MLLVSCCVSLESLNASLCFYLSPLSLLQDKPVQQALQAPLLLLLLLLLLHLHLT